jgi:hypothetical protein
MLRSLRKLIFIQKPLFSTLMEGKRTKEAQGEQIAASHKLGGGFKEGPNPAFADSRYCLSSTKAPALRSNQEARRIGL